MACFSVMIAFPIIPMHCLNSVMIVFWNEEGLGLSENQAPRYLNSFELGVAEMIWLLNLIVLSFSLEFVAKIDFDGLIVMFVSL